MSHLQILNTDQINKYNYKFSLSALESSLRQTWGIGTPSFISHDYHRPYAWCKTLGIWIMPHQAALIGRMFFANNEEERVIINDLSYKFISQKIQDVAENEKQDLLSKINKEIISADAIIIQRECVSILDKNIAKRMFPEIFLGNETDKHSLISLKELKPIAPGVFEYKGLAIFAHRFFRRSLSQFNNLNTPFLEKIQSLISRDGLDLKIAIDPHALGLIESYKQPIELDYWWGPKFDNNLNDIPTGVSVYKSNEIEGAFSGVSQTEFWWHNQDDIQSLECEEVREMPSYGFSVERGEELYGCRYVHSMINNEGNAYHLDGAVRVYSEEQYINRLDVDIAKAGKNTEYYKLWRIDGSIDISLWKSLISDFYKDNHLIGEYFLGEKRAIDKEVKEVKEVKKNSLDYLAHDITEKDGIQAYFSYHELIQKEVVENENVFVCPVEFLNYGDGRWRYIDLHSLDFLKILRANTGLKLKLPQDTKYLAFKDNNVSLPLVIFKNGDDIKKYFQSVEMFISTLEKPESRIITLAIGVEYESILVKLSLIFRPQSFLKYIENHGMVLPSNLENVGEWIEDLQKSLNNIFKDTNTSFSENLFLSDIGQFQIYRKYIPDEMLKLTNPPSLRIHESEVEVVNLLKNKVMTAQPVYLIELIDCDECSNNYLTCECDVIMKTKRIKSSEFISLFWSRIRYYLVNK